MPAKLAKLNILALISVALLLPLLFGSPLSTRPFHTGLPRVVSGDEPHYLVMINSLLRDGDLDLVNNYAAVHKGEEQAGKIWSFYKALDHHTVWFDHGERTWWHEVYRHWDVDAEGRLTPRLLQDGRPPPPGPEFSQHPAGLAIFLAPVLFLFRGTRYVESIAVCCSATAIVCALFMYCALVRKYNPHVRAVQLAALVTFLGTPAWHYARALYVEPYLLLCAIGAYSIALRDKSPLLAGLFIAVGLMLKPPFALLGVPIGVMYLVARDLRSAALLAAPVAASTTGYLLLNGYMTGSPWTAVQPWYPGSFISGAVEQLFSPRYGYLIVAPAIIAAFLAWPRFLRTFPRDAWVAGCGILLQFSLYSSYAWPVSGPVYGPRFIVPLLPLIFAPLVLLPETRLWRRSAARYAIITVCALSVVLNGIAAMPYWLSFGTNPMLIAAQKLFGVAPE